MTALPVLAWVFTGLLLVLVAASVAASRGALRRNHLFGIRITALMHSDTAWRAGHTAAILPSTIAFLVALACSIVGLTEPLFAIGSLLAFAGGFGWVAVRASHAARAAEHTPRP